VRAVPVLTLVFGFLAIFLAGFGAAFAYFGMSSERAYWYQRDPQGDPAHEATPFSAVARRAFRLSAAETRAPLRIAAIGVVLWWVALGCLLVAVLAWLLTRA
jgi:hypothetical protein